MKIGPKKLRFKRSVAQALKGEEFKELDIIDNKIAHSRYWLKINRLYIPKSFIVGTYSPSSFYSPTQPYELKFLLITGEEVYCQFKYRHYDGYEKAVEIFRRVLPQALVLSDWTVFHMLSRKGMKRMLKDKSNELLSTEESCLAVIRHNPVDFLEIMAGRKINKRNYYKVDDSDLYFQE